MSFSSSEGLRTWSSWREEEAALLQNCVGLGIPFIRVVKLAGPMRNIFESIPRVPDSSVSSIADISWGIRKISVKASRMRALKSISLPFSSRPLPRIMEVRCLTWRSRMLDWPIILSISGSSRWSAWNAPVTGTGTTFDCWSSTELVRSNRRVDGGPLILVEDDELALT